jgi:hypothetical protein
LLEWPQFCCAGRDEDLKRHTYVYASEAQPHRTNPVKATYFTLASIAVRSNFLQSTCISCQLMRRQSTRLERAWEGRMDDDGGRTLDSGQCDENKTIRYVVTFATFWRRHADKCRSSQDAVTLLVREHGPVGTDILMLYAQGCG